MAALRDPAPDDPTEGEGWDDDGWDDDGADEAAASGDARFLGAIEADDRLATMQPPVPLLRRVGRSLPNMGVALAAHVALVVLLLVVARDPHPVAEQQETLVEIVQETAPAPDPKKQDAPTKPAPEPEAAKPEATKAASPDDAASKPDKAEPPGTTEPPKTELPKPPVAPDDTAKTLQSLQDELAALKTQQADLQAEVAAKAAPSAALGPLPDSFRAVALPAEATGGEDSVSYQALVFSRLAKAKQDKKAEKHVVTPGVAQVVFDVDDRGALVDVSLAQSSGNAYLDVEAVAIVRRAAPFPPPPQGALRHFSAAMRLDAQD